MYWKGSLGSVYRSLIFGRALKEIDRCCSSLKKDKQINSEKHKKKQLYILKICIRAVMCRQRIESKKNATYTEQTC